MVGHSNTVEIFRVPQDQAVLSVEYSYFVIRLEDILLKQIQVQLVNLERYAPAGPGGWEGAPQVHLPPQCQALPKLVSDSTPQSC